MLYRKEAYDIQHEFSGPYSDGVNIYAVVDDKIIDVKKGKTIEGPSNPMCFRMISDDLYIITITGHIPNDLMADIHLYKNGVNIASIDGVNGFNSYNRRSGEKYFSNTIGYSAFDDRTIAEYRIEGDGIGIYIYNTANMHYSREQSIYFDTDHLYVIDHGVIMQYSRNDSKYIALKGAFGDLKDVDTIRFSDDSRFILMIKKQPSMLYRIIRMDSIFGHKFLKAACEEVIINYHEIPFKYTDISGSGDVAIVDGFIVSVYFGVIIGFITECTWFPQLYRNTIPMQGANDRGFMPYSYKMLQIDGTTRICRIKTTALTLTIQMYGFKWDFKYFKAQKRSVQKFVIEVYMTLQRATNRQLPRDLIRLIIEWVMCI